MREILVHLHHMHDILLEMQDAAGDDLSITKNKRNMERCLEILGEAARRIPQEFQSSHAMIPWAEIIATRNVIAHDYEKISSMRLQQIIHDHALRLIPVLYQLITQLEPKL